MSLFGAVLIVAAFLMLAIIAAVTIDSTDDHDVL